MKDCLAEDPEKRPLFEEIDTRLRRMDEKDVATGEATVSTKVSLFDIFPRHIAEALREGRKVEAEHRECVTIFFSDIIDFTSMSSKLSPRKVADLLDRLYSKLDALADTYEVFKVSCVKDCVGRMDSQFLTLLLLAQFIKVETIVSWRSQQLLDETNTHTQITSIERFIVGRRLCK